MMTISRLFRDFNYCAQRRACGDIQSSPWLSTFPQHEQERDLHGISGAITICAGLVDWRFLASILLPKIMLLVLVIVMCEAESRR
jgi:hypothetical protein